MTRATVTATNCHGPLSSVHEPQAETPGHVRGLGIIPSGGSRFNRPNVTGMR